MKGFLIFFLETLWNLMVGNSSDIRYRVSPNDNTRVIVKMLNCYILYFNYRVGISFPLFTQPKLDKQVIINTYQLLRIAE